MPPWSMTKMRSAFWMVERRCAITKLVLPDSSASIPFCTRISVCVSILDVASSRIRIFGIEIIVRANAISWRCPIESPAPCSFNSVSYPFSIFIMNSCALTAFAAAIISSSVASSFPYKIFSRTVPWKIKLSCVMTPICRRRLSMEIFVRS